MGTPKFFSKTKCPACNGRGFSPKIFGRQGIGEIDGKIVVLYETEECPVCKGTGRRVVRRVIYETQRV